MKKQLETIASLMKELKAKFSNEPNPEPSKFESAKLIDGTVIEWENELGVGTMIYIVDGENQIPAPQGSHVLEDGRTVTVDENGAITEIIEVDAQAQPEQMSADKVAEIVNAKMSEVLETFSKSFDTMTAIFETQSKELSELKAEFEAFKKQPSDKTNEAQKFNRQGEDSNLTARQNQLLKNLKNKK